MCIRDRCRIYFLLKMVSGRFNGMSGIFNLGPQAKKLRILFFKSGCCGLANGLHPITHRILSPCASAQNGRADFDGFTGNTVSISEKYHYMQDWGIEPKSF